MDLKCKVFLHGKSKPKNWFSQTLTEDTRGVSNIEENSTDDTTTVKKKLLMQAEKAFPSGNVLVAYEFMVTQIPQKRQ